MRARISKDLISFVLTQRGEWVLKVSIYKNAQILIFAQHIFDVERLLIRSFTDQTRAADFIEKLIETGNHD